MGGLYGHMSHLHENLNLTFGDLFKILDLAAHGNLQAIEKVDGQNVFYTFDFGQNCLKFARNKTDINNGGFTERDIEVRWADSPSVRDTYLYAYRHLNKAFSFVPYGDLESIFGSTNFSSVWFSAEILYKDNPNVIDYNRNAIVLHPNSTYFHAVDAPSGPVAPTGYDRFFEVISRNIPLMNSALNGTGWSVEAPKTIIPTIHPLIAGRYVLDLRNEMNKNYLETGSSLHEYIKYRFFIDPDVIEKIPNAFVRSKVASVFGSPASAGAAKRWLKQYDSEIYKKYSLESLFNVKQQVYLRQKYLWNIELIIHNFATALLHNEESPLLNKPHNEEVERIRSKVRETMQDLKTTEDEKVRETLRKNLVKLGTEESITTPLEGIVFTYRHKTYKMSGSFAPVNKILGLTKYGR